MVLLGDGVTDNTRGAIILGSYLSYLFRGPIWPPSRSVRINIATDASDGAWGGVLLGVSNQQMPSQTWAHEFFTPEEQRQSSTLRELLGVQGSMQSFLSLCQGAEVYVQTDSQNVVYVQQRGSKKNWLNHSMR